jgi:hypothetical protein
MSDHLNDHPAVCARPKLMVQPRQMLKSGIDDTAANGQHLSAMIMGVGNHFGSTSCRVHIRASCPGALRSPGRYSN